MQKKEEMFAAKQINITRKIKPHKYKIQKNKIKSDVLALF
jgi:hypothetical protein